LAKDRKETQVTIKRNGVEVDEKYGTEEHMTEQQEKYGDGSTKEAGRIL